MAYKALYRKYRPSVFEDVVGQDYIIKALKQTIKQNKVGHAYLFCGTRGTGKTSVAKIFAKTINCLNPEEAPCNRCENCVASDNNVNQDIIELDAASNNGVNDVREIIEQLKYVPFQSKYKVYIIDEVHMLSGSAFNALLKSLEEPPEYVVFILATTEPNKVLPTIISRCQRFDFLRVDKPSIIKRLKHVSKEENIDITETALKMITDLAEGGMRDALSILDQCIAYSGDTYKITENSIKEIYGLTSVQDKINFIEIISQKKAKDVLIQLKEFLSRGVDFKRLTNDFVNIYKETILYSYTNNEEILESLDKKQAKQILDIYDESSLLEMIDILMKASESYFNATNVYNYFEVACLKMMNVKAYENPFLKPTTKEDSTIIRNIEEVENNMDTEEHIEEVVEEEDNYEQITEDIEEQNSLSEEFDDKQEPQKEIEYQDEDIQDDIVEPQETIQTQPKQKNTLDLFSSEEVVDEVEYYDNDMLLQLVVQCGRDIRTEDEIKFKENWKYKHDLDFARYVNLLSKTQIAASGRDCILLMSPHETIVNEINEKTMNLELYKFIKDKLDIDKMIFGLTENQYKDVLALFKKSVEQGTLPNPYLVRRYEIKEEKPVVIEPVDKVIDLFGLENVNIVEEDN